MLPTLKDIQIKPITHPTLPEVYEFVIQLAIFEKEPEAVKATIEDYQNAFNEGIFEGFIAYDSNKPVGMTVIYTTFSTWKGKMLYLEDFYVHPDYRSKGVGQLLFDNFISYAKKIGCSMVKWEVLDWNKEAIRFYERNGATIEKFWWDGKIIF